MTGRVEFSDKKSPSLEGFWTNPLVVVGEAPSLSQTGYKAYT